MDSNTQQKEMYNNIKYEYEKKSEEILKIIEEKKAEKAKDKK